MKNNKLIQWWMTPKFPLIHLDDKTSFVKKWFFHPIKRRFAKWYLLFLQKFTDIKVIAITGSAGKTTTKEMLASILKLNGKTVYSKENIDPIYNIPTTILKTPFDTKYLILEMGIEYPNEMDFYLWLVKPDIGVITNIFPTHLEFLKDVDGVLNEKSKLVLVLRKNDIAILNSDDILLKSLKPKIKSKIIWVKRAESPFIQNGYFAGEIASSLGVPIKTTTKGLSEFNRPKHRMDWFKTKSGAVVFDDSYNSNPQALLSTLKMFLLKAGKNNKIAVIGDMLELGEKEEYFHRLIGREVVKKDFQVVICVGRLSKFVFDEIEKNNKYTKVLSLETSNDVLPILKDYLVKDNYIYIKGSRSIGLDRVASKLN